MRGNDPVLHTVPLADLRPTQVTIGTREVARRQAAWTHASGKARALLEVGADGVFVHPLADPYRSLAGAVRRAGGFAKDTTPFLPGSCYAGGGGVADAETRGRPRGGRR